MHPRGHELVHIRSMNWVQKHLYYMSRVSFLCANVIRHFRSHDRLVYNVTLSQISGSNRYPARLQPGAIRSSSPVHERSWSMTRPNREKHHETCQETSPTCHTSTLDMRRVGITVDKSTTVEGLPWVPARPTLGSRFFSGL